MPALYIVLEKQLPNTDGHVNGKALSKYNEQIEAIAKGAGVPSLMNFFSALPDELAAFFEDHGVQANKVKIPEEKWFTAEEGLRTVNTLLGNPEALPEKRVEEDLLEFRRVLELAKDKGIRWHLAVDY